MHRAPEYPPRRRLVLIRHGQSRANADGLFTGLLDSPLTDLGRHEATAAGLRLREEGLRFDAAFTSTLVRAIDTSRLALDALGQADLVPRRDIALDERDYGVLSGLDKETAYRRFGAERVEEWRRSYAGLPPDGESLKDTVARMVPFYLSHIESAAMRGEILVVGHGNALRGLVMMLEGLGPREVETLEIATASIRIYEFGSDATIALRRVIG
ncbi:2,3-bisphosphoglycerate-dependent phosphoglycerate mutase [Methylorubrum extorquens]|uniref:2,3-bisphosphoglycerate-dependent phosphoglycerate mutase n=1 Tax=Methylorubrum extorquens (strain ATCC 14718 / DSM 1338 / JCM 2805 / NCIMB 9133 / AM1) TaxID=272630 RepID=C5AY29_METEA|nr:2,3-bisphosphoglycerate-dependent phosphoglycerate mutase [Methylorubrum extorquens]ACS39082.1 Phosphoglyceromutase [Methylorubrum extorquens AM1]MCP1542812.1 2,3-bisphosphoglycerate-dependent phosphoglycerate mutase [Methylorubrum extorquens]MCP1589843.1 2,3-bisphosphoglycerate-dependent phosphoglycerate mutase [Methylorubrum extorquens]